MRAEVALSVYGAAILSIPAFTDAPQSFVERIALALRMSYAAPAEIIFSEGEPALFLNVALQGCGGGGGGGVLRRGRPAVCARVWVREVN